jgi:hypothetical protein
MSDIIVTKKQLALITERQQLNESLLSLENVLMAAGFIPVIGGIADIALICYYLLKGEKLYAAIMLIGLIPGVGNWIAAPIIRLFKGSRQGIVAMKQGGVKLTEYLAKNPEAAAKFAKLGKYVKSPAVERTVEGITKVNSSLGNKLKSGLKEISGAGAISGIGAGAKEVLAGGKFGRGLKDYFQGQRLTNYYIKNGVVPEQGIKRWWLNVQAGGDRRAAFRKFISANNLLAYFGIPSLTTFEEKLSNDAEFRKKLADDPKTSDYIAQNYNETKDTNDDSSNKVSQPSEPTSTNKEKNPITDLFGSIFSSQLGKAALTAI